MLYLLFLIINMKWRIAFLVVCVISDLRQKVIR